MKPTQVLRRSLFERVEKCLAVPNWIWYPTFSRIYTFSLNFLYQLNQMEPWLHQVFGSYAYVVYSSANLFPNMQTFNGSMRFSKGIANWLIPLVSCLLIAKMTTWTMSQLSEILDALLQLNSLVFRSAWWGPNFLTRIQCIACESSPGLGLLGLLDLTLVSISCLSSTS